MDRITFREIAQLIRLPYGYPRPAFNDANADQPIITVTRHYCGTTVTLTIAWNNEDLASFKFDISYFGRYNPAISILHIAHKEISLSVDGSIYQYNNQLDASSLKASAAASFSKIITQIFNLLVNRYGYWKNVYIHYHSFMRERLTPASLAAYRSAFYEIACKVPRAVLYGRLFALTMPEKTAYIEMNRRHSGASNSAFNFFRRTYLDEGIGESLQERLEESRKILLGLHVHPLDVLNTYDEFDDDDVIAEDEDDADMLEIDGELEADDELETGDEFVDDDVTDENEDDADVLGIHGEPEVGIAPEADDEPAPEEDTVNEEESCSIATPDEKIYFERLHKTAHDIATIETFMGAKVSELQNNDSLLSLLRETERRNDVWFKIMETLIRQCVDVTTANLSEEIRYDTRFAIIEIAERYPLAFLSDITPYQKGIEEILAGHKKQALFSWQLCVLHMQNLRMP